MKKIGIMLIVTLVLGLVLVGVVKPHALATEKGIQASIDKEFSLLQENDIISDNDKIERILDLYFMAVNQDLKIDNISLSEFYCIDQKSIEHQKYLNNKFKFKKEMSKKLNHKILWDNQDVQIKDLKLDTDTATVKVYVLYKYILNEYDRGFSGSGTEYDIILNKYDNKWLIKEVKSNDEFDKEYFNKEVDVEKIIKEKCCEPVIDPAIKNDHKKDKVADSLLPQWSYVGYQPYGQEIWRYTLSYALSYNSRFASYSSDCQNFGSQCVWFGFGGNAQDQQAINNKTFPMVDDGTRAWFQTSTIYDTPNTWVWTGCEYFAPYINNGGYGNEGPYGYVGSAGDVSDAEEGDIIQIRQLENGVWRWYHTYIVDDVSGTAGSRANSNIWVSAHTTNRQMERLDTIIGSSQSNLRLVEIAGYYRP